MANSAEGTRRRPGIREVAARAQVGTTSVSRVLSQHPDVSDDMRRRVMAAVTELGYVPNRLAQSLRSQQTSLVGFVLSDIANPLLAEIVRGAEEVLDQAGYSLLLTNSRGDSDEDARHITILQQRQVDGLIVLTAAESHQVTLDALARLDVPVVAIDRQYPPPVTASYVHSNHHTGVSAAVNHLLDLGHRRIGMVVGDPVRAAHERRRALMTAYQTRELKPTYVVDPGHLTPEHGRQSVQKMLDSDNPPTAIILGGNQLLSGALAVIRERSLHLGTDLSLVTSDDVPLAQLNQPPISVITRDAPLLGRTAASVLLRQLTDMPDPQVTELPTHYLPRDSCGPPHTSAISGT